MKITGIVLLSIVALLILVALSIQIPGVQQKITQYAVSFLQKKIGTKVTLDHFSLAFPKAIVLEGIYLEDKHADTLFYASRLSIDTDLWGLTKNTIQLNDVTLTNSSAFISRSARDSSFNFDYIVKAFAGQPTESIDTTATPWTFNVGDISLDQIRLSYKDSLTGTDVALQLGSLSLDVKDLNLEKSVININNIALSDTRAELIQWKNSESTSAPDLQDTSATSFNITFKQIQLKEIGADYKNTALGQHARINLGNLIVNAEEIDLTRQVIKLDRIELSNSFLSYQQSQRDQGDRNHSNHSVKSQPEESNTNANAWAISLKAMALNNNNIQYNDFNTPQQKGTLDFSHIWLTRFSANAENISLMKNDMRADLRDLTLVDQSGFSINSLKGSVIITDTSAQVANLFFQTPDTQVNADLSSSFVSLNSLGDTYPNASVDVSVKKSTVALSDILYLSPTLLDSLPLTIPRSTVLGLSIAASGKVNDLRVAHFELQTLKNTSLSLFGKIKGLPGSDPFMDLNLKKLFTTKNDITSVLPDTLLPKGISLPAWIDINGKFNGTLTSPKVTASLRSDAGNLNVKGKMKQHKGSRTTYEGSVDVNALNLGSILGQPEKMGKVSLDAKIDGAGLSMEEINTRIDLTVHSFEYQDYTYKNFKLNGNMQRYFFSGKATLDDKNLDFALYGDMDYNKDVPEYQFTFALKNADFKALHLSERPLKARGTIDVKVATSDFTSVNGDLNIRKVAIYNGNSLYAVDSLLFASIDQEGESKISIRSDIVSGDFEGTINLASIPQALRRHFNEYFSLRDSAYNKPIAPQNFSFNLVLKNTDLLTEIIFPALDSFVPGKIEGEFDSEKKELKLRVDVARLSYSGVGLDSLSLDVMSDNNSLEYTLGLRKIVFDTLRMEALRITGKVANDSIRSRVIILDSTQREKYVLGGAFYSLENAIQFRFLPDEVILHYAPWLAPDDNYLRFTTEGIIAHNFSITNINEKISFITSEEKQARTAVVFKDLNLQNLTNLVEGTILADGLINGDFIVSGKGSFRSKLGIKQLKILDVLWGDLALDLEQERSGSFNIGLGVKGDNVELMAKGKYVSDSTSSQVDIQTDISRINLKAMEPLTGGQLKNTSGIITGEVSIKGKVTEPQIRGFISFEDAAFVPAFVNSKFILKDERITLTEEGIIMDNFKILDEKNNAAVLKGSIKTKTYSTFDLNLALTAKNFQILNTTVDDSELFYGKVGINTNATITGTFTEPKIDMAINLTDESQFTYIVPQSEKGVLEQKGIVLFVDRDAKDDPFLKAIDPRDTLKSKFTGLDLTANIELSDKETFSIVIDPVTGDKLTVQGNSTLTLAIDPTGDMTLSGRYEITKGSYDLTFYKLVKRKFDIEKGSTIIWDGDALDAIMDIKASFLVETSPLELISGASTTVDPQARQRLPFLVYLNIDGRLLTPEISFELDMPKDRQNAVPGVYARIKDINTRESDLNKQVFALLILKRFISDNIFDSQGGSVASTARSSVSRILTEQLNRMSENIKGVQLSFDVKSYEDYTSGSAQGQTEVQLGVTKSLLDDRLVVKVSGNVDIEGDASNQSSLSDYIGDLALEYKLTPDGRFRITGFRNSDYDIISGELIETGAGLIYIKDYDTLRELFKANAKQK